jgi:tetratricopeptide (TPR) repeat protein
MRIYGLIQENALIPDPDETKTRTYAAVAIALLLVVYALAYLPALGGSFIWDDDYFVSENPTLRSWTGLLTIWTDPAVRLQYYPLVHTSFWIENHLWGLNPIGFHLVNLILHALNAWLLWRILKTLRLPGAAFAAALFLIHPVHVESVAWITERKNVLSGLFYLLSMLAWLKFDPLLPLAETTIAAPSPSVAGSEMKWYAGSFLLYIAALLSKSVTCSLPAVLLLLIWWRRGTVTRKDALRLAPFFAVGLVFGLLTAWMEKKYVGAQSDEFALKAPERILVAGHALWFYAGKLVWPNPLAFIYYRWHLDLCSIAQWIFPLSALAVIAALFALRNRLSRGPLVAVLCFAGTLVPAIGFFNVYPHRFSFVADHFQYLASIFMLVLLAALAARWIPARVQIFPASFVLVACGGLVWQQAHVYQNLETLWRDTLSKNPECWLAHFNYGNLLKKRGDNVQAIAEYRETLKYYPEHALALSNLAGTLEAIGNLTEAEELHTRALAAKPDEAEFYFNLGALHAKQGHLAEAMREFEAALQHDEKLVAAHVNLANALLQQGHEADAMAHFLRARELDPDGATTANNLGAALARTGKPDKAIEQFEHACQLNPRYVDAYVNWGMALSLLGQRHAAAEKFLLALEIDPLNPIANFRIAEMLAEGGHAAAAAPHYQHALERRPDWPDALARYAWLLATSADENLRAPDQALRLVEKSLQSGPARPWVLDVKAAALAASKQFPQAVEIAERAEALAREQGHADVAAVIAERKKRYEAGLTYVEPAPKP